jgi:hypothetical protein
MKPDLILIANSTRCRLLVRHSKREPLEQLDIVEQPQGRTRASEIGGYRPGYAPAVSRPGGVDFASHLNPLRMKHRDFARLLSQRVDAALSEGRFGRVVLFSSCPFLGVLKAQLSPLAKKSSHDTYDVDLTAFENHELAQRVNNELDSSPLPVA